MNMKNNNFLIFQPSKSAMQSAFGKTEKWCLSNTLANRTFVNSVYCWTGTFDSEKNSALFFDSQEAAIRYAESKNLKFEIIETKKRKIIKKSYSKILLNNDKKTKILPILDNSKIITSLMVYDYIVKDESFFMQTKKFVDYLKKYAEIKAEELEYIATLKLEFLGEVKNVKDTYLLLNHYMYSIIHEIEPGESGIIKGDPYEGKKKRSTTQRI